MRIKVTTHDMNKRENVFNSLTTRLEYWIGNHVVSIQEVEPKKMEDEITQRWKAHPRNEREGKCWIEGDSRQLLYLSPSLWTGLSIYCLCHNKG